MSTATLPGLPAGYTARRPALPDVADLLAVTVADDLVTTGEPDFTSADIRETLTAPHIDPALDHWVVHGPDGTAVCWAFIVDDYGTAQVVLDAYLRRPHPEQVRALALQSLVERAVERARARGFDEIEIGAGSVVGDDQYAATLRGLGLTAARRFHRMRVELTPDRPFPTPPPGVAVRAFDREAQADWVDFHRVYVEAFTDHWNFVPMPLGAFQERVANEEFPAYDRWLIADVDGRPGGVLQASGQYYDLDNTGWVRNLAVLREHRGRGVGRFLLEHALALFARDGRAAGALGVDTDNATGALRLYEAVGMSPALRIDAWTRQVRTGG